MRRRYVILVLLVSLCYGSLTSGEILTWNLKDDLVFQHVEPLGDNPNGQWTYGVADAAADRNAPSTAGFQAFTISYEQAIGVPWWHFEPAWFAEIPGLWLNTTDGDVYGSVPGEVGMHPGYQTSGNHQCVVRWTAPDDGEVRLTGQWWSTLGSTTLRDLCIVKNENFTLRKNLDNLGQAVPFNFTVCVYGGDIIDFAVGVGSDGGYGGDSETLTLAITLDTSVDPGGCPIFDPNAGEDPIEPNEPVDDPDATSWNITEDIQFVSNPSTIYWSYGSVHVPVITPEDPNNPPARPWDVDHLDTTELNLFDEAIQLGGTAANWWFYAESNPLYNTYLIPCVYKNITAGDMYGCPPGKTALHPQAIDENTGLEDVCVVRWTSNRTATFIVEGAFNAGAASACDYFIIQNATTQLFRELDTYETKPFKLLVSLDAGDTLDFVVGAGTDRGFSDTTPLDLSIIANPPCEDVGIYLETDFNQDCYINLEDFAILAQNWLKCTDPQNPGCE